MSNVFNTVLERRSIRRFKPEPISREQAEKILEAAIVSPSGKNRQPWRYIAIHSERERHILCEVMQQGLDALAAGEGEAGLGSARGTLAAMRQATFTVLVIAPDTPHAISMTGPIDCPMHISDIVDLQSIGGAIQSMLLTAWDMGIGSLWICDTFQAYPQLVSHYKLEGLLVAAVSFGIADETPTARPRMSMSELVQWK